MIPLIWKTLGAETGRGRHAGADAAEAKATKESSAVIGIAGAIGALGGFLIPITFGSPWVDDPVEAVKSAFIVFAGVLRGVPRGDLVLLPADREVGHMAKAGV